MYRFITKKILSYFSQVEMKQYGLASKTGGCSADMLYQRYAGKFYNKQLHQFKNDLYAKDPEGNKQMIGVNILTTQEQCKKCVQILMKTKGTIAWDTQTMDLDVKKQAPVGQGKIICASFFAGPQYNFGRGAKVFIDNFGTNSNLINHFKPYLQSKSHLKVWHNYGFDRHIFYNHGIDVQGFGGDTMHMARLQDASKMFGQYSLAALTKSNEKYIQKMKKEYCLKMKKQYNIEYMKNQNKWLEQLIINIEKYLKHNQKAEKLIKIKMQHLFGRKKILKSGVQGVTYQYPTTLTLHTSKQHIQKWIHYSTLDSQSTFFLKHVLMGKLSLQKINLGKEISQMKNVKDLSDFYLKYWLPFGQLLTDMQRQGIKVDVEHMKNINIKAKQQVKQKQRQFIQFLHTFQKDPNINYFNPSSPLQLQQLFFAPLQLKLQQKPKNKSQQIPDEDLQLIQQMKQSQQDQYDIKQKKNVRKQVVLNTKVRQFQVQTKLDIKPKKITMQIEGLQLPAKKFTPLGLPSVQQAVLQQLCGDPNQQKYGLAYKYLSGKGQAQFGKQLCKNIKKLIQYRNIETLIKNFIQPLTNYIDKNQRIHCSLNINTQTGRLSAKKPNLQNQPAYDKDIYKIRQAFTASKGKKLIVADYGQLELRVLAHLTNCKAMINAFKQGGDFHSRTAIGMYSYIKQDLEKGNILLEWDKSKGNPPVPLLKDKYAAERKKAKTVNFSIAYGKSAKGFAADWGCSQKQAKQVINAWFRDRFQVKQWQQKKQNIAKNKKITQTLLGRSRRFDNQSANVDQKRYEGMVRRRAINTPVQGGAADIVIAAMVKIWKNQQLKQLGYKLILQIHDELILQGPQQHAAKALQLVKRDMQHPFEQQLRVALEVDAKIGNNWYECK